VDGEGHVGIADLSRGVGACAAARHLVLEDVEADRLAELPELNDERQTDVSQTDDTDNAHVIDPAKLAILRPAGTSSTPGELGRAGAPAADRLPSQ